MLILVVGCAPRSKGPSPQARREAMQDWARQGSNYRSTEGFQEARWGMALEEVQALFPEAKPLNRGALHLQTTIAKMPAAVNLGFLGGRFVAVDVVFLEIAEIRESHQLLRDLLSQKYGPPVRDRDTADEAQRRAGKYRTATEVAITLGRPGFSNSGWPQDGASQARVDVRVEHPDEEALLQARAARSDFKLWSRWRTTESHVKLTGLKSPNAASIVIEYESARYESEITRARALERQEMVKDL
ncbi:hypothetical protein [Corallococcus sicarius]|uniref:hypothetical protein n=1 Tax=Corallococcus sicarius TaxID=2316726 RepID=UPI0011C3D0CA|nr:hypothetical protein [Corallococcus sicarius]